MLFGVHSMLYLQRYPCLCWHQEDILFYLQNINMLTKALRSSLKPLSVKEVTSHLTKWQICPAGRTWAVSNAPSLKLYLKAGLIPLYLTFQLQRRLSAPGENYQGKTRIAGHRETYEVWWAQQIAITLSHSPQSLSDQRKGEHQVNMVQAGNPWEWILLTSGGCTLWGWQSVRYQGGFLPILYRSQHVCSLIDPLYV